MKKFLLLILPIVLCIILIACDSTNDVSNISPDTSASLNSSTSNDSSVTSDNEDSKIEYESSVADTSTDSENSKAEATIDKNVELINADALEKYNLYVKNDFNKTITLTFEGNQSIINSIDPSEIKVTIDLSSIVSAGSIECIINIDTPDGLILKEQSDEYATIVIAKRSTETPPDTDTPSDNPPTDSVYISNGIVISGTRGMEQFGGGATAGERAAGRLNQFKDAVGDNVNVYILPAPIASAFYAPDKYPNSIKNHQNCFYALRDALVNVKFVDTLAALGAHTEEDIYFRTDHHWQALGAYYAAQELAKVAEAPFDTLASFNVKSVDGVVGSLYGFSNASVLKKNPDTMTWYEPTREHTVTYYSRNGLSNPKTGLTLFSSAKGYTKFIHGDSYTTHIQSNVGNGRKLLIFKDSFGNALAPFVLSSFDEVYIADFRYFKLNAVEFIDEHGITDVCFSMAAFSVTGKSDYIIKLMNY